MIPEDFQGKIPSVSFYELKFQPIHWKILINVNIRTKVSYLKLKQNSFIILREEEMSNLRLRKIQSLCKFSDSESIHLTDIPMPRKLGAETHNQEEVDKRDESI